MTRIFLTRDNMLKEIPAPEDGCWISMVRPDEEEINALAGRYEN